MRIPKYFHINNSLVGLRTGLHSCLKKNCTFGNFDLTFLRCIRYHFLNRVLKFSLNESYHIKEKCTLIFAPNLNSKFQFQQSSELSLRACCFFSFDVLLITVNICDKKVKMSLRENTLFVVVSFENWETEEGKKMVELLPRSWVTCENGVWFCKYPPPKQYRLVHQWTKESKEPKRSWVASEVTIIKQASKFSRKDTFFFIKSTSFKNFAP